MKKESLQYILQTMARIFENSAEKTHIDEFKAKYRGVPWHSDVERSLLSYARTRMAMKRWIENLICFMNEKNIVSKVE